MQADQALAQRRMLGDENSDQPHFVADLYALAEPDPDDEEGDEEGDEDGGGLVVQPARPAGAAAEPKEWANWVPDDTAETDLVALGAWVANANRVLT